jgi:uncharacterized protein (TIGR02246 family)
VRNTLIPFLLMMLGIPVVTPAETNTEHAADTAAINAVLTDRFIAGWNAHDAHVFASAFAEDADFTNVRGVSASGRYQIEQFHAQAFQRMFMHSHQTAEVKKIRFLKPDVAVVDVRWEMTGALTPEGNPAPTRSGLLDLVFTSSGGRWLITVMHNTDLTPVPATPPDHKTPDKQ